MRRLFVFSLVYFLTAACSARAQLVVRVEANGAAVYGAEVAAWSDSGRIAMGRADGAGVVRLPILVETSSIAFITARRMGFSPTRLSYPSADSVTLFLTRKSQELATVAVTARPLRCPARSEPEAVALWQRAAARYTAGQDTMPWSYTATVSEETVSAAERGFDDDRSQQRQTGGATAGTTTGVRSYGAPNAFIYGTYEPPFVPAYRKWVYPLMYGSAAGLFATEYFGSHHTFLVLGHSGDATTLGFCARSRSEPEIEGELEVGSDTLLLGARWSFRLPHDEEDAGGEATFGEAHLDGARYLIAVTSASWRRVRAGLYEQERHALDAWKFGHTDREAQLQSWSDKGDRSMPASPQSPRD